MSGIARAPPPQTLGFASGTDGSGGSRALEAERQRRAHGHRIHGIASPRRSTPVRTSGGGAVAFLPDPLIAVPDPARLNPGAAWVKADSPAGADPDAGAAAPAPVAGVPEATAADPAAADAADGRGTIAA